MSGLKEHSRILLYGREARDFTLADTSADSDGTTQKADRKLASIYGFEFEGHYYDLPKPAILQVSGTGQTPSDAGAVVQTEPRLSADVQVWSLDKDDMSIRLDVTSGPLADILLEQAIDDAGMASQTSGKRVSGKRVSGKRMSGD